jgi:hypothetical protein
VVSLSSASPRTKTAVFCESEYEVTRGFERLGSPSARQTLLPSIATATKRSRVASVGRPFGGPERNPLLAKPKPTSAFSRFALVHRTDLKGQQRVHLTGSPRGPRMTAVCAFEPFERRLKSTLSVRAHYQAGKLHLLSKARRSFHFRFRSAPQYASAERLGHIARVARSYGLAVAWDSASMFLFKSLPLL